MADINIQRSRPGSAFGWIIGIIALIVLLWFVLAWGWGWGDRDVVAAPSVGAPIADMLPGPPGERHP